MKEIATVVVTFNRLSLLKEEIKSLRAQTISEKNQLIVVNNGSTDGTLAWLEQQTDIITLTQENSGGAGGFFTGMKYAVEQGYRYCWLMDDDVVCRLDALDELYKAYHLKENIGFVCSRVQGTDGCEMNVPYPDMSTKGNAYPTTYAMLDYGMVKISSATFVSVFLSTDIIRRCGLPYREYFIWGDDSEYTERLSKQYDCYLAGKSRVIHKRAMQGMLGLAQETDPIRVQNYFFYFRNNYYRKYRQGSCRFRLHLVYRWLRMAFGYIRHGQMAKAKVILRAVRAIRTFNPQVQYPQQNANQ